jgi:hypothetical protein
MEEVNNYSLHFNTIFRDDGSVPNPTFKLIKPIVLSNPNNYFEVALLCCQVPFAWHMLRPPNNTIYYTVNSTNTSFILDQGSYTILTLLSSIEKYLNGLYTGSTFTFSFNSDTQYASFILSSSTITYFKISFSLNSLLCRMLGYQTDIIFTNITPSISSQQVNVSQAKNLYVRSSTLQISNSYESISASNSMSNILEVIPLTTGPNNYITFMANNLLFNKISNNLINIITINLSDDENAYGDIIPLLLNWTFSLRIREMQDTTIDHTGELPQQQEPIKPPPPQQEKVLPEITDLQKIKEKLNNEINLIKLKKDKLKNSNS